MICVNKNNPDKLKLLLYLTNLSLFRIKKALGYQAYNFFMKDMAYWIVKINRIEFELWTDEKYFMMIRKCEYYGAKPFWLESRKIESPEIYKSSFK